MQQLPITKKQKGIIGSILLDNELGNNLTPEDFYTVGTDLFLRLWKIFTKAIGLLIGHINGCAKGNDTVTFQYLTGFIEAIVTRINLITISK